MSASCLVQLGDQIAVLTKRAGGAESCACMDIASAAAGSGHVLVPFLHPRKNINSVDVITDAFALDGR